ncbi:MAG: SpoIIE family protein phosphatase [Chlorobi bacterium]|nr:SpoIIE family protein phosphatase [Chlorobiota bacterium]
MNRSKSVLNKISILLLVFSSLLLAQKNITTESITIKDGLSSNIIRDIIQDQYGYIWFATADGVNIYDGYNITVIKNNPGDSTSLPSNQTYRMLEDKHGNIWITTNEGLARYERDVNSFVTFKYSNSTASQANIVLHIFEDSRGNLWVSTKDGTLLFNRETEKFQRYEVMNIDNSIANYVNYGGAIVESDDGDLYTIAQSFGLLKFDYESLLFVQVPLKNNFKDKILLSRIFDVVVDSENNLWLAMTNGLFKIDLKENKGYDLTPFERSSQRNFWDNAATGLLIDKNNNIWVGTGRNGIYLFDTKQQKFERLISTSSSLITYEGFFEDNSGLLWLGSSRGVLIYDFYRKPFETFKLSNNNEENSSIAVTSFSKSFRYKDNVWLGTVKGIHLFDNSNKLIKPASRINKRLSQVKGTDVSSIQEIDDGTLWLSTLGKGLYSFDLKTNVLKNYKNILYDNTTIATDFIHTIELDKKEDLWVGTHLGLNLLKKGENDFIQIPSFLNRKYEEKLKDKIVDLRKNSKPLSSIINVGDYADISKEFVLRKDSKVLIYSMGEGLPQWNMVDFGWLASSDGDTLWSAGEYSESFYASGGQKNRIKIGILNLKGGRYKLRYKSDDSHSVESYNTLPPQDSSYWGTQIFSLNNEEFSSYQNLLEKSVNNTFLQGEDIKTIIEDSKNNIWVGTDDGLSKIDSNFTIQNFLHNPSNQNSLSNNFVRDVKEDLDGNIWIATADGLNKLDPTNNTFTVLRERDGLPTANLSAIEVDNEGDLWVSGLKGISKIELGESGDKQIIVNYDVKDGLQGYEFIRNSSFKDKNGKLYFAGLDGFNAFYPGSSNRTPPFVSIQNIKVSNKSVTDLEDISTSDINLLNDLSLPYNQNDLSFDFASIHFSRPDKNRLLYKLEGVDEEWQVGDRRFASYTNLDPGDYVFKLKGSNGDGIWNENTKTIDIHIASPWYNNWTAYTVYAFLFFGIMLSVRKIEMTRQQKNAKIKESQLQLESAELKAQAAEAQALVVQAEYELKKKELEEARQLQLSMLPKELPQLPHLDIAVYMKTATEVGGDYYDFHIGLDGTLTVVLGDATGHGMKAGTMVTTTKSLFNVLAPNPNIVETFHEMTRCLKLMHMEKLSMCMTMIKIMGNKIQMSAAGMPPIFIYKRESQSIEEHMMKGMPLGTFSDFPYSLVECDISSGDTILMMSDGFPELMNEEKEMFGYKQARNLFEEVSGESSENIISKLKTAGSDWMNDNDPDDDVTFVVIKIK